ncbi:MAG: hypothetical protein J5636_05005 [Clostridiales bacterium]|nr:hypothetical protein [Clostridiales bacterium]
MQHTIAIIDTDNCFSSLLISRLKKQLPDFLAYQISRDVLVSVPTLLLDCQFLLYNQFEIAEEEIMAHCSPDNIPVLIPLLSEVPPFPPKDIFMLVHEVESRAGLGKIPLPECSSVQTCLTLSFVPLKEREAHVVGQIRSALTQFDHIIRLDIMPGILMPEDPPSWNIDGGTRSSGIPELLMRIRQKRLTSSQIPSFLEPDPYGDLRFGRPEHSDDLIACHPRTISHLISRTISYLHTLDGHALLLCVCDGISFRRMQTLCRQFTHLEILTPLHVEKDIMLLNEIDQLQRSHLGTTHIDFPFTLRGPNRSFEKYQKEVRTVPVG